MANIVPDSFKTDLLKGTFNFDSSGGSTFKLALYTSLANFSTSTPAFTTTNEVSSSGTNYTSVTLTAAGALIYKGSSNEAVLVLDFGGAKTATNGDFVIQFPTADSSNAIIRLGNA